MCGKELSAAILSYENGKLRVFLCSVHFLLKKIDRNSEKHIDYSHIDKLQCGHPKRAELLDVHVNINTGIVAIKAMRFETQASHAKH